jgi:hypothetical protein
MAPRVLVVCVLAVLAGCASDGDFPRAPGGGDGPSLGDGATPDDAGAGFDATASPQLADAATTIDHPDAAVDAGAPPPPDAAPECGDAGSGPAPTPRLALVSARDHIEGCFLVKDSLWADATRIYLASRCTPRVFVLARDRASNFPVVEVVETGTFSPAAMTGAGGRLFVAMQDGTIRVYRTDPVLTLESTIAVPGAFSFVSLDVTGGALYVGVNQAFVAVDESHVYVAALNDGDVVQELLLPDLVPGLTYGLLAEPFRTAVYERATGSRLAAIDNPPDLLGRPSHVTLHSAPPDLLLAQAGCCGRGVFVHSPPDLAPVAFLPFTWTNTVVRSGRWLLAGNEVGQVSVSDLETAPTSPGVSVDLRLLTGHTGPEDIEIRALFYDGLDDLVFAGSSWGNDTSRGPDLPSFFVLEFTTDP